MIALSALGTPALAQTDPKATTPPPDPGRAQHEKVEWHPGWPRFRVAEYVATGTLIVTDIAIVHLMPDPKPRWQGGVLFDDAVGDFFRASDGKSRETAQRWSNGVHEATFLWGMLGDPLTALTIHRSPDVAFQLALINAQSFALTGFVQLLAARLVGRTRPYTARCTDGNVEFPCKDGGETLSFISGHAATSFTAAGLVCAHHSHLPLWGGGIADGAACALTLAAATTSGVLRIAADKHHTTDVMIGAGLGFLSGFVLPLVLHYPAERADLGGKKSADRRNHFAVPMPMIGPTQIGMGVGGLF